MRACFCLRSSPRVGDIGDDRVLAVSGFYVLGGERIYKNSSEEVSGAIRLS